MSLMSAGKAFVAADAVRHADREAIDHCTGLVNAMIADHAPRGLMSCRFHVPLMVPGLPAYDRARVKAGVEQRLAAANYAVGRDARDNAFVVRVHWGGARDADRGLVVFSPPAAAETFVAE